MKMNLAVRFKNAQFIIRTGISILLPALVYLGIEWQSLTTWGALGQAGVDIISNPIVVGLIIINVLNIFPDPVVKGISDSKRVMDYKVPTENAKKVR